MLHVIPVFFPNLVKTAYSLQSFVSFSSSCNLEAKPTNCIRFIANEPAERRRSAGEAAENSAAQRMAYAKKFSIEL